jgi:hypothetical protein
MIHKVAVALALVAAPAVMADGHCGWENESCCDIPKGNPNQGTCYQARTACWEGTCMPCGKDGKPVCPSVLSTILARMPLLLPNAGATDGAKTHQC